MGNACAAAPQRADPAAPRAGERDKNENNVSFNGSYSRLHQAHLANFLGLLVVVVVAVAVAAGAGAVGVGVGVAAGGCAERSEVHF